MYIHVTLLPFIAGSNELKSKPTQHSVKELLSIGIQPNIIVCRTEQEIPQEVAEKIALFCNVRKADIIQNMTAPSLYEVPMMLEKQGLAKEVCYHLGLINRGPDLADWIAMTERQNQATKKIIIGLVGKYVALQDAYLSVAEALRHGGIVNDTQVEILWLDSEKITSETVEEMLSPCNGIIIPGGFGDRGIEGMIEAIRYARENLIPAFGICLGMQMMVIETARNLAGLKEANSSEFQPNGSQNVIDIMDDQKDITEKGGTMRLGLYPCKLVENTLAYEIYNEALIYERHRHRWEFNNAYRQELLATGLQIAGLSPDNKLVEIVERPEHPWFIGVQFHPEFKSRPNRPQKLFADFIRASLNHKS